MTQPNHDGPTVSNERQPRARLQLVVAPVAGVRILLVQPVVDR